MSSINLSFKEWPFVNLNQIPQEQEIKPSILPNHIDIIKSTAAINVNASINFQNLEALKHTLNKKISEEKKLNATIDSDKPQLHHLSAWGRCGLYACTYDSCLCIFSNDKNQCLSPIYMFSPFEIFQIGKSNENNPKKCLITAIAFSNGYLQPSFSKPYLAVSSERGQLIIYDINTKEIIGKKNLNEQITAIFWSSFKINRLYLGTSSGHFYICDLNNKRIKTIKILDFNAPSEKKEDIIPKSVDFITQDSIDGNTVAIASKDGSVGYITNLKDPKQSKIRIFQDLPFHSFLTTEKKPVAKISYFQFYPNSQDFVIIATNLSTFLISISKGVLIPFIQTPNCKFISILDNENDKVIVGDDNHLAIWSLVDDKFWVRSNLLKIGKKFDLTEILTYTKFNNKFLLTTASNWLTEIQYYNNKLFISKRIKLMNGIPIDYDFGAGSIAFLDDYNSISITQNTPNSIIKSKLPDDRHDEIINKTTNDIADDNSKLFRNVIDNSNSDYDTIIDDDQEYENHSQTISNKKGSLHRSNSFSLAVGADTKRPFDNILVKRTRRSRKNSDCEILTQQSDSDFLDKNTSIKYNGNDSLHGTSNSFVSSYNIPTENKLKNIKWISKHKLIAWNKESLFAIDLNAHEVKEPFLKKIDKNSHRITQVFFSKSCKIMCLILNNQEAFLINTESDFEIIKRINFKDILQKDIDNLVGSMSPNEDQTVFISYNYIFFTNVNDDNQIIQINSTLEFDASYILWKKRGILIGTKRGNAFLIAKKKILEICTSCKINNRDVTIIYDSSRSEKTKLGSIKSIMSGNSYSLIFLDSNNQAIIFSGEATKISDNIKSLKKCSKETILAHFQNYDKLIALKLNGDNFSPPPPPCDFTMKNPTQSFYELVQNNSISNQQFLTKENNPSVSLRNNVHLLNQIISMHDPFIAVSIKMYLELGYLEKARDLLLKTNSNDKCYLNSMMMSALYECDSTNSYPIQLVLDNLIENNFIDLAVDVSLITKNVRSAADILYKFDKFEDASHVLMMADFKDDSDEMQELVKEIADCLISRKINTIQGLKLLASFGCTDELMFQLSLNLE